MKLVAVLALAACSVPAVDLEGKACPCSDGYVCNTVTNQCVRSLTGNDGGRDGAGDSGPEASCLGTAPGALIYETDFDDFANWSTRNGNWSIQNGEVVQSDATGSLVYAEAPGTFPLDYRAVSKFRMIAGGDGNALELSVHMDPGTSHGQYHCNWEPTDGEFLIMYTDSSGQSPGVLAQKTINITAIPGYVPTAPVVMEFQVVNNNLTCCIRDIPNAILIRNNLTSWPDGAPGLKTYQMSGAYDYLRVYAPQ